MRTARRIIMQEKNTMADRIRSCRKQAHLSQKELGEKMGVTRNTVVNWEAGKYRPDAGLFPQLCAVLNISLNELFGLDPAAPQHISDRERSLLFRYRQLSPVGRRVIEHMAGSILEEETAEKDRRLREQVRMIDFISTAAAAGDGWSFSDIPVDDYRFVFSNDRNEHADGMIRVKGHSMLPVYCDGDYVYVQYTNHADPGEDVLCSSLAGVHIKRLGENGVYSLNRDYPFTLTSPEDRVQVIGKVLGIVSSSDYPDSTECDILQELRRSEIIQFQESHGLSCLPAHI